MRHASFFASVTLGALFFIACTDEPVADRAEPSDTSDGGGEARPTDDAGSPEDAGPDAEPATAADCAAYGKAYCKLVFGCAPGFPAVVFADEATCESRIVGWCDVQRTLPGRAFTSAGLSTCTTSITAGNCESLANLEGPAGCSFQGSLPSGSDCAVDAQCASLDCSAKEAQCGQCLPRMVEGESCAALPCKRGLYCDAEKKCAAKLADNQPCSDFTECKSAACVNGACAPAARVGEACAVDGETAPTCNPAIALVCDDASSTCQELEAAGDGEPCGVVDGAFVICKGGFACDIPASGPSGICTPEIAPGGACTAATAHRCAPSTACIKGACRYEGDDACE